MHDDVEWMEPPDRPILVELAAQLGWIKPASLALNLPYSESRITERCRAFTTHGLVTAHDETTAYRISRLGRRLLFEAVDAEELTAGHDSGQTTVGTTLEFTDTTLEE